MPEPQSSPQHFEVVLLKDGVSERAAKVEDFKRIPVTAADPIGAITSRAVQSVAGFRPLFAAPPGVPTEPEILAKRRAMEGEPEDRSKI